MAKIDDFDKFSSKIKKKQFEKDIIGDKNIDNELNTDLQKKIRRDIENSMEIDEESDFPIHERYTKERHIKMIDEEDLDVQNQSKSAKPSPKSSKKDNTKK